MPFGAEIIDQGIRFALWAPGAKSVSLGLEDVDREIRLVARPADWWEAIVREVGAGARYRYLIDGKYRVPDPASRFQADDVSGPSEVIDPEAFEWQDGGWRGRPWSDAVIYELHIGGFTPQGTFRSAIDKLDYLLDLGVTALELMPVADFPGQRNWGYDGVLPFAPDASYGRPEDLKALVQEAHRRGLMVLLDVVYNHFGPEGNYLPHYASRFFTDRHSTPWGAAINFDGEGCETVRRFFIENALYWLEEFHFDGLRLDAVHAIKDTSPLHILDELREAVCLGPGKLRHVHLVLENDANEARHLRTGPGCIVAQWNDDFHHALHVLTTGECQGYYADYADDPVRHLLRSLTEGFAFQGETSVYRDGKPRGEPTTNLTSIAFVNFLQNHDQVGNRAFGERVHAIAKSDAVEAAHALMLLAPSPPLLFMGEEFDAAQPFPFFCDLGPGLAQAVTEGRRAEFAKFPEFSDASARARIPDPMNASTFASAVLDWSALDRSPHREKLARMRELLKLRVGRIAQRLPAIEASSRRFAERAFAVAWTLSDRSRLTLLANLSDSAVEIQRPDGELLYATKPYPHGILQPFGIAWFLWPAEDGS